MDFESLQTQHIALFSQWIELAYEILMEMIEIWFRLDRLKRSAKDTRFLTLIL